MFETDPKLRPTADDCLKHEFFTSLKIKDETEVPVSVEKYSTKSKSESTRIGSKSNEKNHSLMMDFD